LNVAVGGTNTYFPDGQCGKPWSNADPHSVNAFWDNRGQWQPTWDLVGNDSAMQIKSVTVTSLDSKGNEIKKTTEKMEEETSFLV
jgi:hypothetical protein